ncbi:hypothetical protein IEC97_23935 [Neobacillus cucumis]|uniref:hypothetical protein n=1 Tax=Neobacillus cucumis TaxID=1740721 RepID=UPI0018DF1615|nr:hypothetical protein [Neobacillus cucumis]MBI0580403.1 hypothetical protein [Neobacillus cucumis]
MNPAWGDQHPRFGYPGSEVNVLELTEHLQVLLEIGYISEGSQNVVVFEVKPVGNENSDGICTIQTAFVQAWARV